MHQELSPLKTSGAEVVHGPNPDIDEGSDDGVWRSHGQIQSYGRLKGPYGPNNLGHDLGHFAACRIRIMLHSEGFAQIAFAAISRSYGQ